MTPERHYRILALAAVFVLLIALLTSQVMTEGSGLVAADQALGDLLYRARHAGLLPLASAISYLGNWKVVAALTLAALAGFCAARERGAYLFGLAISVGGAAVSTYMLKQLVGRARPGDLLPGSFDSAFAFPSFHAAFAIAFYGFMAWYLAERYPALRGRIWCIALVLALLIGCTRLYLGAHYVSDVLAGYLLGAAWLFIAAAFIERTSEAVEVLKTP